MPVFKGSRYENSFAGRVKTADGTVKPVLFRNSDSAQDDASRIYQVTEGDRLDQLAFRFYGTATLWWVIADANPSVLLPDPLTPGDFLRIPRGTAVN